jgi:hypothetical protein
LELGFESPITLPVVNQVDVQCKNAILGKKKLGIVPKRSCLRKTRKSYFDRLKTQIKFDVKNITTKYGKKFAGGILGP